MTATRATTVSIVGLAESSHAYSSWSARARALVSGRGTEPRERVGGLGGRLHRLGTFADPRQRLSLGLRGEHAEPDRYAMCQRNVAEAARDLASDVFEMRRLAADHASQRHDRVEALTRGGGFRKHRQFEGAGRPRDFHVRVRDTGTAQRLARTVEQFRGDILVKPADHDRHAPLADGCARPRGGFVGHDQWVRKWPSLSRLTSR